MAVDELSGKATDLIRRVLTVGVGAIFLTEESLRGLVSELKLPTELLRGVLASANQTKKEFLQGLSSEILSKIGDRIDPAALLQEIISKNEIELTMKIKFSPKAVPAEPEA